jgi:acetolactate synthase I/II/III large subunit
MANQSIDRRSFLKGAAATAATVIGTQLAANAPAAQSGNSGAETQGSGRPSEKIIARPGSDFMVDVIKATGIEYIASNPGSSFRSLQESIVNYGDNKKPEFLTCMHEESSVGMAQGYAKVAGKPMGIMAHGTVGLQHAAMAVYNAWCDRVPVVMFAGNFLDAEKRRPAWSGITASKTRRHCCVILSSGTISRCHCNTSPSRSCEVTRSPPRCPWDLC